MSLSILRSSFHSPRPLHPPFKMRQLSQSPKKFNISLCGITNEEYAKDRRVFNYKIRRLVVGGKEDGVTMIQQRERSDNCIIETLDRGVDIQNEVRGTDICHVVNDRLDIALAIKAHGFHLGKTDMPYKTARKLKPDAIIGKTVYNMDDVLKANDYPCLDYIGVQVFKSNISHPNGIFCGLDGLQRIKRVSKKRILAVGNINLDNLEMVARVLDIRDDGDGVGLVGRLWRSEDPANYAKECREIIRNIQKEKEKS